MVTPDLDDGYDAFEEFNRSAGMGIVENPYPMYALVRPQHPMKREDDQVFTAYSFDAVQQVLKDGESFSSQGYADIMGKVLGHSILEMDEPEHHLYRGLVQQAFSRKAMETWERELVRDVVDEHINTFIDRPEKRADLVREVTFPFPVVVISRLLGLPREDLPMFHRRVVEVISAGFEIDRAANVSQALFEYFCTIISDRRVHPQDDVISVLVNAELEGTRLNDEEICSFLRLLLPAGAETTYRSSSNLLHGLLSNPDQLDALRADRALMPQAIEEGLRWEAPLIGIMRTAARDVEVEGELVAAGSFVAVNIGSANHDEKVWDNPEDFDIFRPQKQHLAFAWGPHMCLGLHLARMETRVVLTQLLDRLPGLRPDPDAEPAADLRRDLPRPGGPARRLGLSHRHAPQRSRHGARALQLRPVDRLHAQRLLRLARRRRRGAPRVRCHDRRIPHVLGRTGQRPQHADAAVRVRRTQGRRPMVPVRAPVAGSVRRRKGAARQPRRHPCRRHRMVLAGSAEGPRRRRLSRGRTQSYTDADVRYVTNSS